MSHKRKIQIASKPKRSVSTENRLSVLRNKLLDNIVEGYTRNNLAITN